MKKLIICVLGLGLILSVALSLSGCGSKSTELIPIVDCHVHLWDTNRPEGISWPRPEHKQIYRPYLPEHISPIAKLNGVKGIVALQSGDTTGDNQWNLDIIESDPLFKGVVGNLSRVIGTSDFEPLFKDLCKNEKYLGYRLSGKYQGAMNEAFFKHLKMTAAKGKTVDFIVRQYTFEDISTMAERVPDLRIMLNHFGGVSIYREPLKEDWKKAFRAMGQYKNVYCKVSALYGRFQERPAPQELEPYREILDLAYEVFGPDRLVYSSDWPVTERTGDYTSVVKLTKSYFMPKGREIATKVFFENAVRFYRIPNVY